MNYYLAKKLNSEDEVMLKKTGKILKVVSTRVEGKTVRVLLENGKNYFHTDIIGKIVV